MHYFMRFSTDTAEFTFLCSLEVLFFTVGVTMVWSVVSNMNLTQYIMENYIAGEYLHHTI